MLKNARFTCQKAAIFSTEHDNPVSCVANQYYFLCTGANLYTHAYCLESNI